MNKKIASEFWNNRRYVLAVVLIMLASVGLRFWGASDYSLGVDEAISSNAALSIIERGAPYYHDTSELIYDRGPLHTQAIAASIRLFGRNELAVRLPYILAGILSVFCTWLLARVLTSNRWVHIIAVGAMAFSFWGIGWSHNARMYELLRLWSVLTFLCVLLMMQSKAIKQQVAYGCLALVTAYLGYSTHRSGLLLLPTVVASIAFQYRQWIRQRWQAFGLATVSVILLGVLGALIGGVQLTDIVQSTDIRSLGNTLKVNALPWRFLVTQLPLWFVGFWYWGLGVRKDTQHQWIFWLVVALFFIVDVLIYSTVPSYRHRYFQLLLPLFFVFGSLGIVELLKEKKRLRFVAPVVGVLFLLSLSGFTVYTPNTYEGAPDVQGVAVAVEAEESDIIIAHPTATAYWYFGHVDFWLVTHPGEIRSYANEEGIDYYAGAEVLDTVQQLEQVADSGHGYVVIESGRERFISANVLNWVKAHMRLQSEASNADISVWEF